MMMFFFMLFFSILFCFFYGFSFHLNTLFFKKVFLSFIYYFYSLKSIFFNKGLSLVFIINLYCISISLFILSFNNSTASFESVTHNIINFKLFDFIIALFVNFGVIIIPTVLSFSFV